MLSGKHSKEMKISNILFPQVGIELTICRVYSNTVVPLCYVKLINNKF